MGLDGIERPFPEVGDPGAVHDDPEVPSSKVLVAPRGAVIQPKSLDPANQVRDDEPWRRER